MKDDYSSRLQCDNVNRVGKVCQILLDIAVIIDNDWHHDLISNINIGLIILLLL